MMNKPYLISAYDCAGLYVEECHENFSEALNAYVRLGKKHPDKVIYIMNLDCADYDSTGLTREEQERLANG